MADLLKELEAQIAGLKTSTARQNVGVIREIGDGVARVEGLTDAMLNEMLDLGHGITGLALNLEETEVGVVILGDYTQLQEGDEVRTTGKLLQVPVGKSLLGRVVNTLGEPLDGKGPIESDVFYPVEKIAPGIIRRSPVRQPVQTGIMAIDAMIPIGRGQRELKDDDLYRHHHQPGIFKQSGRGGGRQRLPSSLLHLRCDRSEAIQYRPHHHRSRTSRSDALHDYPRLIGIGLRHQPVPGAIRRRRDG
jgi:ATP synthase alpha/beta family, beta-barrel domain